jgi:MFS family permease
MIWLLSMFAAALIAGAFTFNIVTIAMPKVIDEKLGYPLPLALTGSLTTVIFIFGALTQIAVGRLIDRFELPALFLGLSVLQPVGLVLAATTTGLPMALGLALATAAIYGQVVINDAMIGRYVSEELRNRVYSWRFFIAFTLGGFAVPLIAGLRGAGGFTLVLLAAGAIGAIIFATAIGTWALTRGKLQAAPVLAE